MERKLRKYANFLLTRCLSIKAKEPLLINYHVEEKDFANIVKEEAFNLGIKDVYEELVDNEKIRDIMLNSTVEEIKNNPYFSRKIVKDVYDMGGSLLFLDSFYEPILQVVPKEKREAFNKIRFETQGDALEARRKMKYPYSIVAVATKTWADQVFPGVENNVEKLWDIILDIALINEENPVEAWNKKIEKNNIRRNYLNELKLKKLKYTNNLGTNLELELLKDIIWFGAGKRDYYDKKDLITNMPTEEIYTTPLRNSANGVVYTSKPLVLGGLVIDKIKFTFKDGKLVDVWASNDLEKVIETVDRFEEMRYLGECALVDFDSPISKTNITFKKTLLDENASCHLALGTGFPRTVKNGNNLSKEELMKKGINICDDHVDFMIGTNDLLIIGTDIYGNDVPIFVDGNFAEEKIKQFIKERNK